MFKNLSIRARIYLLLSILIAGLVVMTGVLIRQQVEAVASLQVEREGLEMIAPLLQLMHTAPLRRGTMALVLAGNDNYRSKLLEYDSDIDAQLKVLSELDRVHGEAFRTRDTLNSLVSQWQAIKARGTTMGRDENLQLHGKFITDVLSMNGDVIEHSGLILEADAASYYMVQALLVNWGDAVDEIARIRAQGVTYIGRKKVTEAEGAKTALGLDGAERASRRMSEALAKAYDSDPALKAKLEEAVQRTEKERAEGSDYVRLHIVSGELDVGAPQYFDRMTQLLTSYNDLSDVLFQTLSGKLAARKNAGIRNTILIGGTIASLIALVLILGLYIIRTILSPLNEAVGRAQIISKGDLTQRIQVDTTDEIGVFAKSMNAFIQNLDSLVSRLNQIAGQLKGTGTRLNEAGQSLASSTEQASTQSQAIASSATQLNQNVQSLSSAIEEMSVSLQEVAKRTAEAAAMSKQASTTMEETDSVVQELGNDARAISEIIDSISSIAAQTNLLALNAAIEAASAGEAGRGFAVVAGEVKELARQASRASDDVKARIAGIQKNVNRTIDSVAILRRATDSVNEINSAIAAAIEEQSITTREIAGSVAQASQATAEVTRNIDGISQASRLGAEDAGRTSELAGEIHHTSMDLAEMMTVFKSSGH